MELQRMQRTCSGFTLLELMIVVAIISLLAAIALPSYDRFITKSRRVAGSGCLMEMVQFSERYHTTKMTYDGLSNASLPNTACRTETTESYDIGFSGTPGDAFVLQAVPLGRQLAKDTLCGTLTIDSKGTRGVSGSGSVSECF